MSNKQTFLISYVSTENYILAPNLVNITTQKKQTKKNLTIFNSQLSK